MKTKTTVQKGACVDVTCIHAKNSISTNWQHFGEHFEEHFGEHFEEHFEKHLGEHCGEHFEEHFGELFEEHFGEQQKTKTIRVIAKIRQHFGAHNLTSDRSGAKNGYAFGFVFARFSK